MFSRKKSSGKNDKKKLDKSNSLPKKPSTSHDEPPRISLKQSTQTNSNSKYVTPDPYSGIPYSQDTFPSQTLNPIQNQTLRPSNTSTNTSPQNIVQTQQGYSTQVPSVLPPTEIDPKLYSLWFDSIIYGDLQNRWEETPYHEALASIASDALGSDTTGMDGLQVAIIVYKNSHADWRLGRGISNDGLPLSSAQMEQIVSIREDILEQILDAIQTIHLSDNKFGTYKNSSTHLAAFFNDINLVSRLLAHGARPDTQNLLGFTPIMITTDLNVQTLLIQHQRFLEYEKNLSINHGSGFHDIMSDSFADIDSSANSGSDTDFNRFGSQGSGFLNDPGSSTSQNSYSGEGSNNGYQSFLFRRLSTVQEEREEDIMSIDSDQRSLGHSIIFGDSVSSFVGVPIEESEHFRPDLIKKIRPSIPIDSNLTNVNSESLNSPTMANNKKPVYSSSSKLDPIIEENTKTSNKSPKRNATEASNSSNDSVPTPTKKSSLKETAKQEPARSIVAKQETATQQSAKHDHSVQDGGKHQNIDVSNISADLKPLEINNSSASSSKPEDIRQYKNNNSWNENSLSMHLDSNALGNLDVEQIFLESDSMNGSMLFLGSNENINGEKTKSEGVSLQANKVRLSSSIVPKSSLRKSKNRSSSGLRSKIESSTESLLNNQEDNPKQNLTELLSSKAADSKTKSSHGSITDSNKTSSSSDLTDIVQSLETSLSGRKTAAKTASTLLKTDSSSKASTPFSSDLYSIIMGSGHNSKPYEDAKQGASSLSKSYSVRHKPVNEPNTRIPRFLFKDYRIKHDDSFNSAETSKVKRSKDSSSQAYLPDTPVSTQTAEETESKSNLSLPASQYTKKSMPIHSSSGSLEASLPMPISESIGRRSSSSKAEKAAAASHTKLSLTVDLGQNNPSNSANKTNAAIKTPSSSQDEELEEPSGQKSDARSSTLPKTKTHGKTSVGLSEEFAYNLEFGLPQTSISRETKVRPKNIDGEANIPAKTGISSQEEISSCESAYSKGRLSQRRKKSKEARKSSEIFRNELYIKSNQCLHKYQKHNTKNVGEMPNLSDHEVSDSGDDGSFISRISKYSSKMSNKSRRSVSYSDSRSSIKKMDLSYFENTDLSKSSLNNSSPREPKVRKSKSPKYNLKNNLSINIDPAIKSRRNSSLPEKDSMGLFSSAIYSPSFNSHINVFKSLEGYNYGDTARKSSSGSQFDLMGFLYSNPTSSINSNTTSLISSVLPQDPNVGANFIVPPSRTTQASKTPSEKPGSPRPSSLPKIDVNGSSSRVQSARASQNDLPIPKLSDLANAELMLIQKSQSGSSNSTSDTPVQFRLSTPVFKTTDRVRRSSSPKKRDSGSKPMTTTDAKTPPSAKSREDLALPSSSKSSSNEKSKFNVFPLDSSKATTTTAPKNLDSSKKPPAKLYKAKLVTKTSVDKNINRSIEQLEQKLNSEAKNSATSRRESGTLNKIRESGIVRGRLEMFSSSNSSINTALTAHNMLNGSRQSLEVRDSSKNGDPKVRNRSATSLLDEKITRFENSNLSKKTDSSSKINGDGSSNSPYFDAIDIVPNTRPSVATNYTKAEPSAADSSIYASSPVPVYPDSRQLQMQKPNSFFVNTESDGASSGMRQGRDYTSGDSRIVSSSGHLGGINSDSNLEGVQSDLSFRGNMSALSLSTRANIAAHFYLNPIYDSSSLSSHPGEKAIKNNTETDDNFAKLAGKRSDLNQADEEDIHSLKVTQNESIPGSALPQSVYNFPNKFHISVSKNFENHPNPNLSSFPGSLTSSLPSELYSDSINTSNISAFPASQSSITDQQRLKYLEQFKKFGQPFNQNDPQANERSILSQTYDIKTNKMELMEMATELVINSSVGLNQPEYENSTHNSNQDGSLTTSTGSSLSENSTSGASESHASREISSSSSNNLAEFFELNDNELAEAGENLEQSSVYSGSVRSSSSESSTSSEQQNLGSQNSRDFAVAQRLNELYVSYAASRALLYKECTIVSKDLSEVPEDGPSNENNRILFIDNKSMNSMPYPKLVLNKDGSVLRKSFLDYNNRKDDPNSNPNSPRPQGAQDPRISVLTNVSKKSTPWSFLEEVDKAIQQRFKNSDSKDVSIKDYQDLSISAKKSIKYAVNEDSERKFIDLGNSNDVTLKPHSLPWFITPLNGSVVSNFFSLPSPKLQPGYLYLKVLSIEDLVDLKQFSSFYTNVKSKQKNPDSLKIALIIRNGLDTKYSIPIKINPEGKMQVNQEFVILADPLKPITCWLRVQYSLNKSEAQKAPLQKFKTKNIFNNLKAYEYRKPEAFCNTPLSPKNLFKKINSNIQKRFKGGDLLCWPFSKNSLNTRSSRIKSTNGKRQPLGGIFSSHFDDADTTGDNDELVPPNLPFAENRRHSAPQLLNSNLTGEQLSSPKLKEAVSGNRQNPSSPTPARFRNNTVAMDASRSEELHTHHKQIKSVDIGNEQLGLPSPRLRVHEDRGYSSEVDYDEISKTIDGNKLRANLSNNSPVSSKRYSGAFGPTIFTPKELYEGDRKSKLFKHAENNFFLDEKTFETSIERSTSDLSNDSNTSYNIPAENMDALSQNASQETFGSNIESETLGCAAINIAEMLDEVYLKMLIDSWDVVSAWEPKIVCRLQLQMFYIPISRSIENDSLDKKAFDLKHINYPILANNLPKSITYCQNAISIAEWHNRTWASGFLSQLGGDCSYWRRRYYRLIGGFLVAYKMESNKSSKCVIDLSAATKIVDLHTTSEANSSNDPIQKSLKPSSSPSRKANKGIDSLEFNRDKEDDNKPLTPRKKLMLKLASQNDSSRNADIFKNGLSANSPDRAKGLDVVKDQKQDATAKDKLTLPRLRSRSRADSASATSIKYSFRVIFGKAGSIDFYADNQQELNKWMIALKGMVNKIPKIPMWLVKLIHDDISYQICNYNE